MTRRLSTKLFPPVPCSDLVERPRLVERFEAGAPERGLLPLLLLNAGAGTGKTTLLAEWVASTDQRVAWLSLDPLDNDAQRFLAHLVAALGKQIPGLGDPILLELDSPDPPPAESLLSEVINELDEAAVPVRLVLDDYQVIESEEIHEAVTFLIDNITPQLGVIISARTAPPLPVERWLVRGVLEEIRGEDLRFRDAELAKFLCDRHSYTLTDSAIESLAERTEGWIAGIRLACHSVSDSDDAEARLEEFSGGDRVVIDYLLNEVLLEMTPELREFVVQTSVLDRLHGPLCDAVTGGRGSQPLLEELERSNLFIVALDRERSWFRYHHLFADLLRSRENHLAPEALAELHTRASGWFEGEGSREEALHHAIAALDWDRTERLLEPLLADILGKGECRRALHWLERIPDDVLAERPELLLSQAWANFTHGKLEKGKSAVERAERVLEKRGDSEGLGEIEALRAFYLRFRGDFEQVTRHAKRGLELLPKDRAGARCACFHMLGAAQRFVGRQAAAIEPLEQCIELGRESSVHYLMFGSMNTLANSEFECGQLHRAAQRFRDVIEQSKPDRPLHVIESHSALGNILREWDQLDAAEVELVESLEIAARRGVAGYWPHSFFNLGRVHFARGDHRRALEEMDHALEMVLGIGYERGVSTVRAERAKLQLLLGDSESPREWYLTGGFDEVPSNLGQLQSLVRARALLAWQRTDEALAILDPLVEECAGRGRVRTQIEGLILTAECRGDDGLPALAAALEIAAEPDFVRVFLDEGIRLRPLLEALAATDPRARAILDRGEAGDLSARTIEPLSTRELEVLRKIEAGRSNQDIGRDLFVSPNTVKSHVQKIFRKLSVRSRTQAIAEARTLGILD